MNTEQSLPESPRKRKRRVRNWFTPYRKDLRNREAPKYNAGPHQDKPSRKYPNRLIQISKGKWVSKP